MRNQMPEQDRPIYDFYLKPDGTVTRDAYDRYAVCTYPTGIGVRTRYMLRKPSGAVVSKTPEQMDKFVSGHVFTFRNDADAAREMMLAYYRESLKKSLQKASKCEEILKLLE